ncbi:succinylglutamate desuccinylase/aspartoacylase family protein [Thalassospira lucentensis]|uniref:Succinylglutamate desuccinylase n=1 Tax=Thalassospira lucentensis TaxID=168935 RepID=A0A358HUN6_9PROT|nr:succinylglutamate desuccinylase/aspartoacylase family protein [Thalassospira lucentensis]HBU98895.1 succinylglutamate desuccinylase [Thalassospira lucentensis]HCW67478.1 succinylglutamate desuccinylase [Thalassospira lucentensis]
MQEDRINLVRPQMGTSRALTVRRYGKVGLGPKAYFQAALHADELPGVITLHHLEALLKEADAKAEITGEIVIVPFANPIGFTQYVDMKPLGRFEMRSGQNFNRHYPDLSPALIEAVASKLTQDADQNVAIIRAELRRLIAKNRKDSAPLTDLVDLRLTLAELAIDADYVMDLHCDWEAPMHLYISDHNWPDAADLSAQIGSECSLIAEISGDNPFDETFSRPWVELRRIYGDKFPIPMATLATTIELRGDRDVYDDYAIKDADNLFKFLQRRGLIKGNPGELPDAKCDATPLSGVDRIMAPHGGMVVFHIEAGAKVKAGQELGYVLDCETGQKTGFSSRTNGVLYSRIGIRLIVPGGCLCSVAGAEPLPGREGQLLLSK